MTDTRKFLAALNRQQGDLLKRSWPFVLGYVVLLAGAYVISDLYLYEFGSLVLLLAVLNLAATYLLLVGLLARGGFIPARETSGFGTYFVVGLISDILIGLGLVLLVLPGLYLLMRGLPAYARARTTPHGASSALLWSWRATERFQKPLSIALIGPVLCYAATFTPTAVFYQLDAIPYELSVVLADVLTPIAIASLTLLEVASFAVLSAARDT